MTMATQEKLSIGEFAKLAGLSVSALRFYDDCDALKPAAVDPRSGYRSYSPDQVERGVRLRELRALELPLSEALRVLDEDPEVGDEVLAAHQERLAELARSAAEMRAELAAAGPTAVARIEGGVLQRALHQVVKAAASDGQAVLTNVLVEIDDGELRCVATDRYQLAVRCVRVIETAGNARALLPAQAARALAAGGPSAHDDVVSWYPDALMIENPDLRRPIRIKTSDGDFPDYRPLLDHIDAERAKPEAARLVSVKSDLRARIEAAGSDAVRVTSGSAGIAIGPDPAAPEALPTSVPGIAIGPDVDVYFDTARLLGAVALSVGPDVMLDITAPHSPVLVRSADQSEFTLLVMPQAAAAER